MGAENGTAALRSGLICSQCVKRAFDKRDKGEMNILLGELVVEAARDFMQWRI